MRLVTRLPVTSLKYCPAALAQLSADDPERPPPEDVGRMRLEGRHHQLDQLGIARRGQRHHPGHRQRHGEERPLRPEPAAPQPPPGRRHAGGQGVGHGRSWTGAGDPAAGPTSTVPAGRPSPFGIRPSPHSLSGAPRLTSRATHSEPSMTLSRGRDILAIPGPSIIPDRVLAAMQRPAPNIYEGELVEMTETIVADLARVARTAGKPALYIGNGHAAWEAAIANVLAPGHKALVVATGRFGLGWAQMAQGDGRRRRGDGLRLPRSPRPGARRRPAPRRPRPRDPRRSRGADRHRLLGPQRHRGPARRARRRRPPGTPRRRLHRLPRLRPLRDGRLGRRRHGGRLPEGADDPARHGLHLPRAEGRGDRRALRQPLLGLAAAHRAHRPLRALLRHGADPPPLRACAPPST